MTEVSTEALQPGVKGKKEYLFDPSLPNNHPILKVSEICCTFCISTLENNEDYIVVHVLMYRLIS